MKDTIPFRKFIQVFGSQKEFGEYARSRGADISNSIISAWCLGTKYPSIPKATVVMEVIKSLPENKKIELNIMDLINPPKRQKEISKIVKKLDTNKELLLQA